MSAKKYRIPFSRIRTAWLRRALMVLAYLPMVVGNWILILWTAAKAFLMLPLWALIHVIAAPFKLLNEGFIEAWHGRGPGRASDKPGAQEGGDA